ncbi:hypothetical protein Daura_02725 [Dactylosporangium aurantiacum]|uniref:Uncharacterized protein n=1 Tax=Dactylosporangium aurantiacum TaxID=35754 RepID=A0A9Q9MG59_9ACTN|nr:hypothetical protein [Dactylosporangium aurantiacum]MDG6100723.1 hypothetical protein [Dactylosporangium aurantiacum]UWZ55209.1 hypothetical protein Daura_02725 [Dactylosporangium aurantiacum]
MARLRARIERAAALHRHTAALVAAAGPILDGYSPSAAPAGQYAEQHDLTAELRADANLLAPGWLGAQLDALAPTTPLGGPLPPTFVRVGQAHPLDDARFPVVVPLLRAGHIAIDADARDSRVAGLLRSLVLRLLASSPPGSVRIRAVDAVDSGATFGWFTGIESIMPPPVSDAEGLRAVLDEGEQWIAARTDGPGPTLLIVIASLPELTEGRDLARIAGLAHAGPAGRLHLIAAGWPPPPLTAETTQAPLPHATQIAIRNPHAWVGDPPGATFSGTGVTPARLNAPVYLDPDPPADLVRRVCAQLAGPWGSPPVQMGEPSRTAWLNYVAAGQRLDAVRREVIAVVAEHKAALKAARDDLSAIRAKLAHHQAYLTEVAQEVGGRPFELVPSWQETQAAAAVLTGAAQPAAGRRRGGAPVPASAPPAAYPQQGSRTATLPVSAPPAAPGVSSPAPPPPTGNLYMGSTAGNTGAIMGPFQQYPGTGGALHGPTGAQPVYRPPVSGVPAKQVSGGPVRPAAVSGVPVSVATNATGTGAVRPLSPPAPDSLPGRVSHALRVAAAGLKQSEAALATPDGAGTASSTRVWINAAVYFTFAVLAAVVQVPTLLAGERFDEISLLALPCALVLPALAFGLGWLTIGATTRRPTSRTPVMGMAISLLSLIPMIVFAAVLFLD